MKKYIMLIAALLTAFTLAACSGGDDGEGNKDGDAVEISFMYWGGTVEKDTLAKVVEKFNEDYAGKIKVNAQHVPNDGYATKLTASVASNQAPDVAYVGTNDAISYGKEGHLLFVEDAMGDDKSFLEGVLDEAIWRIDGKAAFFSTAMETLMIIYNKDVFDEFGVAYPPSKFEDALKWDEFVDLAKTLTRDRNGNDAHSASFDKNNIATYGFSFSYNYFSGWYPLIASNGGDIFNADKTNTTFNSPEMVDLMTKLRDLIYEHNVVPSPTIADNLSSEALQTGQIAMQFDGNWSLLDYHDAGMNIGVSFYPDLGNGPWTISAPGVTCMFNQSGNSEQAWEFYKYSLDCEKGATELYVNGLWQPIYKEYYTDEAKINLWVDNAAHPPEYRSVVVDNIFRNQLRLPASYIVGWSDLASILNPAVESILRGDAEPQAALDNAQSTVEKSGYFKGRFDR